MRLATSAATARAVAPHSRHHRTRTIAASSAAPTPAPAAGAATSGVVSTTTFAQVEDADLLKACAAFLADGPFALAPTSGGVNNHVRYVDDATGARRVVRLHNNGQDTARVIFEHAVLDAAGRAAAARKLPFAIPKALKSLEDGTSTFVVLPSGDAACVFELIPGTLPKTRSAFEVGQATALMSACLRNAEADVRAVCPTSPTSVYRDIFGAFKNKGGSRDGFYDEANTNAGLDEKRDAVNRLLDAIRALEVTLADIEAKGGLPSTLIHGDVHYDNTLVDEATGEVTGILDFEFASYDWAFMEPAAGLSKYVGEKDPTPFVKDYIRGFVLESNPSEAEIDALPDLIKLRVLETVVYFVARSWAKEDDISQLALRAENYAARVDWIDANADLIRSTMREAIAAKKM